LSLARREKLVAETNPVWISDEGAGSVHFDARDVRTPMTIVSIGLCLNEFSGGGAASFRRRHGLRLDAQANAPIKGTR
jgi:hypothetical protein